MSLKLKIAICDNEKYYREHVKNIVAEYLEDRGVLYEIDTYENGMEFCRDEGNLYRYNIIFLDIDMPGKNGMETAHAIRKKNKNVDIIFVTVMKQYVFEGYKVGAVRYIMKKELDELMPECLDALLEKYSYSVGEMTFPFVKGERKILLKDIIYIEVQSHKLYFTIKKERLHMYGQISELETKLSDYHFVRCHQSYLVNLEHVASINNYKIILSNGMEIPVSRAKYSKVKESYLRYKTI